MSDKPLHARVAEALGCAVVPTTFEHHTFVCETRAHDHEWAYVPRYDTDWSATGPLIEKHAQSVYRVGGAWEVITPAFHVESGPTPLVAVCRLVLALKEAGKL